MTEEQPDIEIEEPEPNYIEIVVRERKPSRPRIYQLFDKVRHLKSPEFIEDFKLLHPECF